MNKVLSQSCGTDQIESGVRQKTTFERTVTHTKTKFEKYAALLYG